MAGLAPQELIAAGNRCALEYCNGYPDLVAALCGNRKCTERDLSKCRDHLLRSGPGTREDRPAFGMDSGNLPPWTKNTSCVYVTPPPGRCAFKEGQHFNCKPLGYAPADVPQHAKKQRISQLPLNGRNRVLCLQLMTRDSWPLVKTWILHHGALVGYHHLYVLDGSSRPETVAFMKYARDELGVNVLFTQTGLNDITKELNFVFRKLAAEGACDFMAKLDTDELLDTYKGSADASLAQVATPNEFQSVLNSLPVDGRLYAVTWTALAIPLPVGASACLDPEFNIAANTTKFHFGRWESIFPHGVCLSRARMTCPLRGWHKTYDVAKPCLECPNYGWHKTFASSATFASVDLGAHGHCGDMAVPPYSNCEKHETPLLAYHYHRDCYERNVQRDEIATLSHNHISISDDTATRLQKLQAMLDDSFHGRRGKSPSQHKVLRYVKSLEDPEGTKHAFYLDSWGGAKTTMTHAQVNMQSHAFGRHSQALVETERVRVN